MRNNFILNTAKDYDMEYDIVERIYNKYPDDYKKFYEALEDYISNRSKN